MAPITWSHSAAVKAPPDEVFAWMSDFSEDDHAREAFKRGAGARPTDKRTSKRTVLRREGNELSIKDTWGRNTFESKVTLDAEKQEVRIRGDFGYESLWRAVPDADGTRVETEGRIVVKGFLRLLVPLFARGLMRQQEKDFKGHIADLEDFLRGSKA